MLKDLGTAWRFGKLIFLLVHSNHKGVIIVGCIDCENGAAVIRDDVTAREAATFAKKLLYEAAESGIIKV